MKKNVYLGINRQSKLTFLSKKIVFTWKYYIMFWNNRSTPETLSGAFKRSAPTLLSGVKKKALAPLRSTLRSRNTPQHWNIAISLWTDDIFNNQNIVVKASPHCSPNGIWNIRTSIARILILNWLLTLNTTLNHDIE